MSLKCSCPKHSVSPLLSTFWQPWEASGPSSEGPWLQIWKNWVTSPGCRCCAPVLGTSAHPPPLQPLSCQIPSAVHHCLSLLTQPKFHGIPWKISYMGSSRVTSWTLCWCWAPNKSLPPLGLPELLQEKTTVFEKKYLPGSLEITPEDTWLQLKQPCLSTDWWLHQGNKATRVWAALETSWVRSYPRCCAQNCSPGCESAFPQLQQNRLVLWGGTPRSCMVGMMANYTQWPKGKSCQFWLGTSARSAPLNQPPSLAWQWSSWLRSVPFYALTPESARTIYHRFLMLE